MRSSSSTGASKIIEDSAQEGNAQFGVRKMIPSGWNLGAWGSIDVRETRDDNDFWQVAGGLEALSVKWDLRLNGYLPVTDPKTSPSLAEVKLRGNSIFMIGGEEVPLYGVNGEIGYLLLGSPETKQGTRYEFRVYGGGFSFDHSDAIDEVAGPSARLELRLDNLIPDWGGSRLTFDAGYSHDDVRGDLWEVGGRIRIPLGGLKTYALLSPQARRMQERIERDDDIVVVQSGPEKVFDTLTGVRFDRVAYVNPSITEVSQKAGDNSLLIVNGTVSGPQELQGNQTLQGGKSTILVTGLKSGVTTSFTAPGPKAILTDPGPVPNLLLLGSNTDVAGLDIRGTGGLFGNPAGISGPGPLNNIVIQQTSITQTGDIAAGISFGAGNSNIRIFDTTVTGAGFLGGIFFGIDNRDIEIAGVTVTNTTGTGIFLGVGANNVRISDTTIAGIEFGSGIGIGTDARNVKISNVDISDIGSFGIIASSNNSKIKIANSTITDTGGDGIQFGDDNTNVTIENTTITNAGLVPNPDRNGIQFGSGNSNVRISGTGITNAFNSGILFDDLNSGVTISGTTITDVGTQGIVFSDNNENVKISSTSITDSDNQGIVFFNQNSNVTISGVAVTDVENQGIVFFNQNSNVTIANTTVTDVATSDGILFFNENVDVTISRTAVTNTGGIGILFFNNNADVTISGAAVTDTGSEGIRFANDNQNVTISGTTVTDTAGDGIDFGLRNIVTITDTTITNVGGNGIEVASDNTVNITGTTIADVDANGIQLGEGNIFALNNSTLTGMFGLDGIFTPDTNTLSGMGNTAAGAMFGGQLCNVSAGQLGPGIDFVDDGSGNPGTCPP
jgi:hypothetical protein